ncbi:MAG: hypothetical protein H0T62_02805 [Parachlamydiaceae bacterium]|nr:hypothetical protein [Parachlamydiaceae bacterium]
MPLQQNRVSKPQSISLKQKRTDAISESSENKKSKLELDVTNNNEHGKGTERYCNGTEIKFTYIHGIAEGEATRTSSNGNVLKFKFKDGKPEGEATETYCNGDVKLLIFKNGIRQRHEPVPYTALSDSDDDI